MSQLYLLQCRLAKDGSDADLQEVFSDEQIKKSDVNNRSERMKSLLRKGLRYERLELSRRTPLYNANVISVKIGADETKIKL